MVCEDPGPGVMVILRDSSEGSFIEIILGLVWSLETGVFFLYLKGGY